jgi:uncharacterized membrane protein
VHTFLKTLHVVAAVFLIGPLVVIPMSGLRAIRVGDLSAVRTATRQTGLYGLLSLLVFALGAAVVPTESEHYNFGTPWVTISMTLFIVALGIILGVLVPALTKAGSLMEARTTPAPTIADGEDAAPVAPLTDSQLDAARGRVAASSGVASLLLVVVTVLMVTKPF